MDNMDNQEKKQDTQKLSSPSADPHHQAGSRLWRIILAGLILILLGVIFHNATRRARLTAEDLSELRVGDLSFLERIAGEEKLPDPTRENAYILFWKVSDPRSAQDIRKWMDSHMVEFTENPSRFVLVAYAPKTETQGTGAGTGIGVSTPEIGAAEETPIPKHVQEAMQREALPFTTVWVDKTGRLASLIKEEVKKKKQWNLQQGEPPFPPILRIEAGKIHPEYMNESMKSEKAEKTAGEKVESLNHGKETGEKPLPQKISGAGTAGIHENGIAPKNPAAPENNAVPESVKTAPEPEKPAAESEKPEEKLLEGPISHEIKYSAAERYLT